MGITSERYQIYLDGRFRLEGPGGREIRVSSAKASGLLALIATEKTLTRHRVWLQDKLWSERGSGHGAGSLRQVLVQIRRLLGDDQDILYSDRTLVGLNPDRIRVHWTGSEEFLAGIDVRDPEFESWLAVMRSKSVPSASGAAIPPSIGAKAASPRSARSGQVPRLAIECSGDPSSVLGIAELHFGDVLRRSMRDFVDFEPEAERGKALGPGASVLAIHAHSADDGICMRVAIRRDAASGADWADSATDEHLPGNREFGLKHLNLCHKACQALTHLFERQVEGTVTEADANFLAAAGLRKMFAMRRDGLAEAGALLDQAYEVRPRGLYLAWRAQLAVINHIESGGGRLADLRDQSEDLCARAIADEPTNANVLAATANARLVFDSDAEAACELSRLSVRSDPSNPLAWWAWSNALLYSDNCGKAYQAARTAQHLSRDASFRFWTDFQVSLTSAVLGDLETAVLNADRSRAVNPSFRPPLRYLIGILSKQGKVDAARRAFERLSRIEPDVTPDRFIHDHTYPISMMRRAGLVEAGLIKEI
ncbi:hypothetical protein [Sedimentitalea sp.]|uniref:hypothetical protein n=1 Tax=Sedimentitalea sp. TaxID=2048915 RepID=UPI00329A0ABC